VERDLVAAEPPGAGADLQRARAFEEWVAPHWSVMTRFAVRQVGVADGEDVVQSALAVAWRKWGQFDPGRGSVRSWLLALVADQVRKQRRRLFRRPRHLSPPAADPNPQVERAIDLERAVQRLSGRQKLAVDLYYYLDLPITDVAAVMGCSQGTAKSTLADARSRLHQHLGDDFR
jgi:RNA polymerase sigma factor (sigma-70 family)